MQIKSLFFFLAVLALIMTPTLSSAQVSVGISVHIGPPVLPVYVQPPCPEPGLIWAPGYWAYGPEGYYWVPGSWVAPPAVGLLWTPGYWGWGSGLYIWHPGYWGPHVGFYGGINYGFGYTGVGFFGGYWRGGNYFYNRSVTNVNVVNIHNTYINNTVINRTTINRVSYNGGNGGTTAQPTRLEHQYENERHVQPGTLQTQHEHLASTNRLLLASSNHGRPSIAATSRAGDFSARNVVAARGGNNNTFKGGNNNTYNRDNTRTFSHNNSTFNANNPNNSGSVNKNYAKTKNNGGAQYHDHGGPKGGGGSHQGEREHDRK